MIQLDNLSYRLISPYNDKGVFSLMLYTPQKKHAVFLPTRFSIIAIRLFPVSAWEQAESRTKQYRITETKPEKMPVRCHWTTKMFSGRILMKQGVELPLQHEYAKPHTGAARSELNHSG